MIRMGDRVQMTGLSAKAPGAYAERVLVQESLTMDVPNGLAPETAPSPSRWRSPGTPYAAAGCGKRETAVVDRMRADRPGSDPDAQGARCPHGDRERLLAGRRALAERCGADVVIDPGGRARRGRASSRAATSPTPTTSSTSRSDTMGKLRKVPKLPWWQVLRAAEAAGATPSGPVVFECVGVPGIIDQIINRRAARDAGRGGRRVHGAGHDPAGDGDQQGDRAAVRLRLPAARVPRDAPPDRRRQVDPTPLITGTVGLDGVADAFEALGDPERHAKILIDPASDVATI